MQYGDRSADRSVSEESDATDRSFEIARFLAISAPHPATLDLGRRFASENQNLSFLLSLSAKSCVWEPESQVFAETVSSKLRLGTRILSFC